MLGEAASHHGVDGDALHGSPPAQRRKLGDKLVGVAPSVGDKAAHQVFGGRDDGQAVGPPCIEHQLNGVGKFGGKH